MSRDLRKPRNWEIKELYELELFMVCHYLPRFDGHRYCSNRDMFLVCHKIKQDHLIKVSGDYNDKSSSR